MAKTTAVTQTGASLHPDLEKMASRHSRSDPPPEIMTGEADAELLGKPICSIVPIKLMAYSQTWVQARAEKELYND